MSFGVFSFFEAISTPSIFQIFETVVDASKGHLYKMGDNHPFGLQSPNRVIFLCEERLN